MFDVGFSEVLVCCVVALIVLGPERLPGVARALGRWTGQAKAYLRNLSAELERETQVGELKKQLEEAHSALREQADSAGTQMKRLENRLQQESSEIVRDSRPPQSP